MQVWQKISDVSVGLGLVVLAILVAAYIWVIQRPLIKQWLNRRLERRGIKIELRTDLAQPT